MTERSIVYRFTAGEISPAFYGGTDLEKYGIGLAKIENGFVDFKGGVQNRPGFEFMDYILPDAVLCPFSASELDSDFLLIFSNEGVHVMQDGQYLVNGPTYTINSIAGNVVTLSGAIPVSPGDPINTIYLTGVSWGDGLYLVTAIAGPNYTVSKLNGGVLSDPAYVSGGLAQRPNRAPFFYTANELQNLRFKQSREVVIATCPTQMPRKFSFSSGALQVSELRTQSEVGPVTGLAATPSAAGSAVMVYMVTAVDRFGIETTAQKPLRVSASVNFTATAGSMRLLWTPVANARRYRIYRSLVTENANLDTAVELGFIGETQNSNFIDANIVPDYTRKPPRAVFPFDQNAILSITTNLASSGYAANDVPELNVLTISGSGVFGYGVVVGGVVRKVIVTNGGRNYGELGITMLGGAGSGGAYFIEEKSPASGLFPGVCELFQQRVLFAGMSAFPMRLWGSKSGTLDSFNTSETPVLSDAFSADIDAEEITPIRHLVRQTNGLLIMHARGVDKLVGAQGEAVGPGNLSVRSEVAIGVGPQPPITINNDVLFVTDAGTGLIALAYTFYSNSYAPQDLTVLAGHLFPKENQPVKMVWQEEPNRLLWVLRADGTLLSLTYLREQEIFAWSQHKTRGYIRDIVTLYENNAPKLYILVERWLQGVMTTTLERLADRTDDDLNTYFGVDCGLRTSNNFLTGTGTLTYDPVGLDLFLESTATPFATAAVEDIILAWGGKFEVLEVVSSSRVRVLVIDLPTDYLPTTSDLLPLTSWSISRPSSTFSGLAHLEGETVAVLADGDVIEGLVVTDGEITLPNKATFVSAGLLYSTEIDTLPLATYSRVPGDGRRKRPAQVALRLNKTRGVKVGPTNGPLYEMKDRSFEAYGEVTRLRSDVSLVNVASLWEYDAQLRFRQDYPLPMTILGFVAETEIEDA